MAWLNDLKIVWKVALIVTVLGLVSLLSISFAAYRMRQVDGSYSDLVNRVEAATVSVARGSRNVESFVSLVYQLVSETSAEGSSRLLSRNTEEMKMYEARYKEALRLIPEKADELDWLNSKAKTMFGECAIVVQAVASADTSEETAKSVALLKSKCAPLADGVLQEQTRVLDDLVAYASTVAGSVSAEARTSVKMALALVTAGLCLSLVGAMWIGKNSASSAHSRHSRRQLAQSAQLAQSRLVGGCPPGKRGRHACVAHHSPRLATRHSPHLTAARPARPG